MANRYWVGGTGDWDNTNTTNWAATSGGAGGQSVPTSTDDVYFTSASGAGTCTVVAGGGVCGNLITTGSTVVLDRTTSNTIDIYGATATLDWTSGAIGFQFFGNTTLTSGGNWFPDLYIGTSKTLTLTDVLTVTPNPITLANGATLKLKDGVTSSIKSITVSSTSGTLCSSSNGSQATVSNATGTTYSKLTIKDIAFTGGGTWIADKTCVDGGNNTGIRFQKAGSGLFFGSNF